MQNKKLTNTKEGTQNNDVVTKLQLDNKTTLIDGARPSYIINDQAVIYSESGAVHAKSFYLQDYNEDEAKAYKKTRKIYCSTFRGHRDSIIKRLVK